MGKIKHDKVKRACEGDAAVLSKVVREGCKKKLAFEQRSWRSENVVYADI